MYMAPEVYRKLPYNEKVGWFACLQLQKAQPAQYLKRVLGPERWRNMPEQGEGRGNSVGSTRRCANVQIACQTWVAAGVPCPRGRTPPFTSRPPPV